MRKPTAAKEWRALLQPRVIILFSSNKHFCSGFPFWPGFSFCGSGPSPSRGDCHLQQPTRSDRRAAPEATEFLLLLSLYSRVAASACATVSLLSLRLRLYSRMCRGAMGVVAPPGGHRPVDSSSLTRRAQTRRLTSAPVADHRDRPFRLLFEPAAAAAAPDVNIRGWVAVRPLPCNG